MSCLTPCSCCPYKNQPELHQYILQGDGPRSSPILLIGEKPHKQEHAFRRPFVGDSGQDLDQHYLPLAGLERPDIRINNMVSCAGNFSNPEPRETAACSQHHLPGELASMPNLEIVVLMGAHACSLVPGLKLDLEHGIPSRHEIFGREYVVFPMYHPASGLHQTGMIRDIRDDFIKLGRLLRGEFDKLRPVDEHSDLDYRVWDGEEWDESARFMGADTETEELEAGSRRAYCFTWSLKPGTGRLVWADDDAKITEFAKRIQKFQSVGGKVVIHNAMFDLPVLQSIGIIVPWENVIDTMVMAYHRWLPQGLKTLAYRLCGMRMQDYSDLVGPYVELQTYEYMEKAAQELEDRAGWRAAMILAHVADWVPLDAPKKKGWMYGRAETDYRLLSTLGCPLPESKSMDSGKSHRDMAPWKRIGRILGDVEKGRDVKLRDRWAKIPTDIQKECELACGELPPDSIRLAPREDVIEYACLSHDSRVQTSNGLRDIRSLVREQSTELVRTFNPYTGRTELRPICGWYEISSEEPVEWLSVITEHTRLDGRWRNPGTRYTSDHRLLTSYGFIEVGKLRIGDELLLPVESFNDREWQVILGSRLGDGSILKRNTDGWGSLRLLHCDKQLPYLLWKVSLFREGFFQASYTVPARANTINGRTSTSMEATCYCSCVHPQLAPLAGRKHVGDWLGGMGPLALAVWYQDDGTLVGGTTPRIYAESLKAWEIDRIRGFLASRFGLETTKYNPTGRAGFAIQVLVRSADRFFTLIAPHVHPVLRYKLPEKHRNAPLLGGDFTNGGMVRSTIVEIRSNPIKPRRIGRRTKYCIDVEETHNFFTMNEIAHNCRDSDAALRVYWEMLKVGERLKGEVSEEDYDDHAVYKAAA